MGDVCMEEKVKKFKKPRSFVYFLPRLPFVSFSAFALLSSNAHRALSDSGMCPSSPLFFFFYIAIVDSSKLFSKSICAFFFFSLIWKLLGKVDPRFFFFYPYSSLPLCVG